MSYRKLIPLKWILIGIIFLFLPSCIEKEATQPISSYTDFRVLSVKELYPQAKEAAKKWQADAYLYSVNHNVLPTTDTRRLSAYFNFRSYAYPDLNFNYDIFMKDVLVVEQSEEKFLNPRPPGLEIHPETLPFDSLDALGIMFDGLGKDFYDDCQLGSWPLILSLEQRNPGLGKGELTWNISFSCDSPEKMNAIYIDAENGEVLEIRK